MSQGKEKENPKPKINKGEIINEAKLFYDNFVAWMDLVNEILIKVCEQAGEDGAEYVTDLKFVQKEMEKSRKKLVMHIVAQNLKDKIKGGIENVTSKIKGKG